MMAETLASAGKRRSVPVERLGDVAETSGSETPPPQLLEAIGNLAVFHREHEKFYSQAPLQQAVEVQAASRVLKTLADRWSAVDPAEHRPASPFAGAEDLKSENAVEETPSCVARDGPVVGGSVLLDFAVIVRQSGGGGVGCPSR
jgi:hypothetical protein